MKPTLTLDPAELSTVRVILKDHLPAGVSVHVFGSRAGGRPKAWSDLDLVVEGAAPLPIAVLAALAEAFDESPLPWKVDIVDRKTVGDAFGELIDKAKVALV